MYSDTFFSPTATAGAVLHDLQPLREIGHADRRVVVLFQDVAAPAVHAVLDLHIDGATDVGLIAEAVQRRVVALIRDLVQAQRLRLGEDFFADLVGAPGVGSLLPDRSVSGAAAAGWR